jgi:hypothetical protein
LKKKKKYFFYHNYNQNKNEIKPKIISNKIKDFLLDKSKKFKTSIITSRNEDNSFNKNKIKLSYLTEINKSKENRINLNNLNKSDNKNMKSINKIIYNRYLIKNNDSNKNYNFTINKFNRNIANLKETKSVSPYFNKPYKTINVIRNNNLQGKYKKFSSQKTPKLSPTYNPIGIKYEENMIKTLKNTLENELLFFSSFSKNEISRNAKTTFTESKTDIRNIKRIRDMNKLSEKNINKKPNIEQNYNKNKSSKNIKDLNFDFTLEINTRKMSHLTRNHDNFMEINDSKDNLTFRKSTYTNKIGDNLFRNIIENEYKNKTSNNLNVKDNEDEKNESNKSFNKNRNIKDICKGYLNFNVMIDNNVNTKPKVESYSFRGKKYVPYNCYNKKLYKALKGRIGDNLFMNGQTPIPKIDY